MKNLLRLLFILLFVLGVALPEAEAQRKKKKRDKKEKRRKKDKRGKDGLTKAERKEWKKKRKALKPAQYKKLMEEFYSIKDRVAQAEDESSTCQVSLEEKNTQITTIQKELSAARAEAKKAAEVSAQNTVDTKGVTFRIQIGAYEEIKLNQYADQENFGVEQSGGAEKFTVGLFKSYREADSLKQYLQKMGLKDAWVVAYRDGSRVDMKEVLNEAAR